MNAKTRIKQLEKIRGTGEQTEYFCLSYEDAKEYVARPFLGGTGKTLTFKTEEAMTAFFDKHIDMEVLHVKITRASQDREHVTE